MCDQPEESPDKIGKAIKIITSVLAVTTLIDVLTPHPWNIRGRNDGE